MGLFAVKNMIFLLMVSQIPLQNLQINHTF